MGLFVKRGFDHVTVAEVAAAADVSGRQSTTTPTKEDLFFDEVPARGPARGGGRNRHPGRSVAASSGCRRLVQEDVQRGLRDFRADHRGLASPQAKELR
jgi:hypothetical protein